MRKLFLATTLVETKISPESLFMPKQERHQDIVWADHESHARQIVKDNYSAGTNPDLTKVTVWAREAMGDPGED